MSSRTMKLTLTVRYEDTDLMVVPDEQECKAILEQLVKYSANHGMISGHLVVDYFKHEIECIGVDDRDFLNKEWFEKKLPTEDEGEIGVAGSKEFRELVSDEWVRQKAKEEEGYSCP